MNGLNETEKIYRKYFDEPVPYNESWKAKLFEGLENPRPGWQVRIPAFRRAIYFASALLVFAVGFLSYDRYENRNEEKKIQNVLLSDSAYNFVTYANAGITLSHYCMDEFVENEASELKSNTRNSLYTYYLINQPEYGSDSRKVKILKKVVDELSEEYATYVNDSLTENSI